MTKGMFFRSNGEVDLRKTGSIAALLMLIILQVIGMKYSNREDINNLSKQIEKVEHQLKKMELLIMERKGVKRCLFVASAKQ